MELIIGLLALAVSIAALVLSLKKSSVKEIVVQEVKSEKDVSDHPFVYDAEKHCYVLDSNLEVTGSITCNKA
jgi:hypothetical protein